MTLRIFLSHSHEDNKWCDSFVNELSKYDVDIWYDRRSIKYGKRWIRIIEDGLINSDIFLIVITPNSWNSDFVQMERELALKKNKHTIGIYLKETEVEGFLTLIQMMNCIGKDATEAAMLVASNLKLTRSEQLQSDVTENVKFVIAEENRYPFRNRILRNRRLLLSAAIILLLIVSLTPFIPFPSCIGTFCRTVQHTTNDQLGTAQMFAFSLVDIVSSSFVLPDNPQSYTAGKAPPNTTGAVLIAKNSSSYYTLIVDVRNLRTTGPNILIDYIALKIQQIPAVPRPLRVWTQGGATTYNTYPYPVTYKGQMPGQMLYAVPPQNVELKNGEDNQISVQIHSTESVYLQFQVQVAYQITTSTLVTVLTLHRTFQVVFSVASNWQQYILQNGIFVQKS